MAEANISGRGHVARARDVVRGYFADRPFASSVGVLAGGAVIGHTVTLLAMPILTRIYGATEFGNLQYYSLTLMAIVSVSALRYETAILLPRDEHDAAGLLCASVLAMIGVTVLVAVALWFLKDSRLLQGDRSALRPYWWLLPISVVGASVYQTLTYWAVRHHRFRSIARTRIAQAVAQSGGQLAFGLAGIGLGGLIIGDALGRITGSFELARAAWQNSKEVFHSQTWATVRRVAFRYRHFPLVSSWSSLVNTTGSSLPPLMLGGFYGVQTLGLYGLMDRAFALPSVMIGQAISQVYIARAARLALTDLAAMRSLHSQCIRRLASVGALPFAIVILAGPQLFAIIFGSAWREAGTYAQILGIAQFAGFICWPLLPTLNILELQSWQFGWDVGRLTLTAGAVLAAHVVGWPPRGAVAAYTVAVTLAYLSHLVLSRIALARRQQASAVDSTNAVEQLLGVFS